MPTILFIDGWRFYFFANEGSEPIHVHVKKGEKKAKYWLNPETYEIQEAYSNYMSPRDRRDVVRMIINNFDYIRREWKKFMEKKS
ncbi:MAG TPA: DUF4160 domain-containing protein [Bacteroidota bacterium]|nr:DUF4160 domain-containing protein [Bacteroidota bacterium]